MSYRRLISWLAAIGCLPLLGCIEVSRMIPGWPGGVGGTLTLPAESGFVVSARINDQPVLLRVETGYAGVVLNPEVAARLGLRESMFENDVRVGPVRVEGETAVVDLTVAGLTDSRRIIWFERSVTSGADGVINIADLPYESVRLQLAQADASDRMVTLRTTPQVFWNLTHVQNVQGRDLTVRFLLGAPHSLLTAAAGAHLSQHHGGAWAGDAYEHPVALEVGRPVRRMSFSRPLSLQGLMIDDALVRTSDLRGRYVLPSDAPADPDEIVVTGNAGRSRASLTVIVGRDHLSRCSSITYERSTRLLTLLCRPDAGVS